MKKPLAIVGVAAVLTACPLTAFFLGERMGTHRASLVEQASHACHIALVLDDLRNSGYADADRLADIEVSLDSLIAHLGTLTVYGDSPDRQREQLALVKAYRTRHPFNVPDNIRCRYVAWSPKFCKAIHADAEAFLKTVPVGNTDMMERVQQSVSGYAPQSGATPEP
jgi:hypothetical protein